MHNVYERVSRLSKIQGNLTEENIALYEAVDRDITKACLAAKGALGHPRISP